MEAKAMEAKAMEAEATPLLKFIKDNQKNQLVIPIYQRVYSWEKEQCKELWDDIIKLVEMIRWTGILSVLFCMC